MQRAARASRRRSAASAGTANLIGKNGKVISFGGAPHLGFSVDPDPGAVQLAVARRGQLARGATRSSIDTSTAGKKHIKVGDPIRIEAQGSAQPFKVSGLVKFGTSELDIGGATLAGFDLTTAQRLFNKEGKLDQIRVSKKPGVSEAQLARRRSGRSSRRRRRCGAATAQAETDASDTNAFTSFLQTFLLSFGSSRSSSARS